MSLTPKQDRFVEGFLVDLNATQAAVRAGYSARTAQEQGSRLLSNVMVQATIAKAMEARSERTEIDQDMVVHGLLREARFLGEGTSHSARVSAWAHLGKHLCMFTDNVNLGPKREITDLTDDELHDIILRSRRGNGAAGSQGNAKKPRKVH